ncbi:ribonuclease HII [Desulfocucumis palustris]|uniref:Ribonuclease HII n=1 Tax=Desulfocucumis palustris TaxID=1898651 RepID=A0A2L2XBL7_9FIRM|nr:ribonuclease HII [Desulfocucumis palustris]GBF33510.1 ribonuclease HII [Desulfocucumis palustris]
MDIASLTVAEIKRMAKGPDGPEEEMLRAMERDARAGVRQLYLQYEKRRQRILEEEARLNRLFQYEDALGRLGISSVAGVDEAGRGPLAGPVMAAAVILPPGVRMPGLNDSKQLTPVKREALAADIKKLSKAWAIGVSTVSEINDLNIHQASLLAMRRAVLGLAFKPDHILVDGRCQTGLDMPETPVVGGDGLCASIAAASILAKVARDNLMELCHHLYPEYGFHRHKGYGTAEHLEALRRFGPSPLHREGFAPVKNCLPD